MRMKISLCKRKRNKVTKNEFTFSSLSLDFEFKRYKVLSQNIKQNKAQISVTIVFVKKNVIFVCNELTQSPDPDPNLRMHIHFLLLKKTF